MVERTLGRTEQLRQQRDSKYGKYLEHFRRLSKPIPNLRENPSEWGQWMRSQQVVHWLLENDFNTFYICDRFALSAEERINRMEASRRKNHLVEKPRNARQTRRAITQISGAIEGIYREHEAYLKTEPLVTEDLRDLLIQRKEGGFTAEGDWRYPDEELVSSIDRRIRDLLDLPEWQMKTIRQLETKREHYEDLLINHFKSKAR